jgi:hypothetical protein
MGSRIALIVKLPAHAAGCTIRMIRPLSHDVRVPPKQNWCPEFPGQSHYVRQWHFTSEIDVGFDVGDWGYNGRVADIGQPTRLTHFGHAA